MTLEEQFLSYLKNERSYSPQTVLAYQKDLAAAKKFWQENGGFPYIPSYRPFAIFAAISSGESWVSSKMVSESKPNAVCRQRTAAST